MATLTRQHFEAIAYILSNRQPHIADTVTYCVWVDIIHDISNLLSNYNENFDKERFLKVCGYYENN